MKLVGSFFATSWTTNKNHKEKFIQFENPKDIQFTSSKCEKLSAFLVRDGIRANPRGVGDAV